MPGRSGAAALLGRELERAELYHALALALKGEHGIVVIAGDAGVGKTTLVADLARRAEEFGFAVGVGHCLDIEAGISFGPVIEALTTLLARIEHVDSRPLARRMRAFLDPATPRSVEQCNLLEDLRLAVLEAAAFGPVLVVLEDLHWADASTRDLAVALSRTARGRLLFVLSVRSDDLHRRHPARTALAEIGRVTGGRRVELGPLDQASIAGIVASMSEGEPDPALVRSVLARSEGNPLYAEEIVAAGPGPIPDQLSDLFLARVDALAEGPRELARTASVDGTRVDVDSLMEVAGIDRVRLDAFLRDLLDANVLRNSGGSLEFRHGLLREAVYDDLLPDERTRLHAELAGILQARVEADPEPGLGVLSRLAFHWWAAHDLSRTLEASIRVGLAAKRLGAAEETTHFERALSVWDRVANPEALAGRTRIEVTVLLGEASIARGDVEAWHRHTRRAVDMLEPTTDPRVASRAYSALGVCAFHVHDSIGAQEAIRLAIEYAGDHLTGERAWGLVAQAQLHFRNDRFAPALDVAEDAIETARAADCIEPLTWALHGRNVALKHLGRLSEAHAGGEETISLARKAGMSGIAHQRTVWLAVALMDSGQVARGLSLARAARDEALASGLLVSAAHCGDPMVTGLTWQGRFDEAETLLEELRDLGLGEGWWQRLRGDLSLARGDVESATLVMPRTAKVASSRRRHPAAYEVLREFLIAAMREDHRSCREVAASYLGLLDDCDSPLVAAAAARIGFQALGYADSTADAHSAPLRNQATRQLQRARDHLTDEWRISSYGVQLALAEGYAARVAGQPGIAGFRGAASLAGPFGPFYALEPRLDLAQELLAHGGRDEGRELLVDCWTAAHDMGAGGIERRAARLATRTRVPLPETAASEGPLSRLTPREREVLGQLAEGATNKTIASALVISEKTASVHVSNILSKLGVENRGAAAALARNLVQPSHEKSSVADSSA